jgi:hypothetical protein
MRSRRVACRVPGDVESRGQRCVKATLSLPAFSSAGNVAALERRDRGIAVRRTEKRVGAAEGCDWLG